MKISNKLKNGILALIRAYQTSFVSSGPLAVFTQQQMTSHGTTFPFVPATPPTNTQGTELFTFNYTMKDPTKSLYLRVIAAHFVATSAYVWGLAVYKDNETSCFGWGQSHGRTGESQGWTWAAQHDNPGSVEMTIRFRGGLHTGGGNAAQGTNYVLSNWLTVEVYER